MKSNKFLEFFNRQYLPYFSISFVLYFVIEVLGRHSFFDTLIFLVTKPHVFFINYLIVLVSFCVVLYVRRKIFFYTTITCIWLTLAIINCVLVFMRNSPFNASDIITFKYGIIITNKYMTVWGIIASIGAILLAIAFCVFVYIKAPKDKNIISIKKNVFILAIIILILVFSITICLFTSAMSISFENLKEGFSENGFPFSFVASAINHGVKEPEDFSSDSVQGIISSLPQTKELPEVQPNVIVIQLESFFDPTNIIGIEYQTDPIPTFHRLSKEGICGKLNVPVIGGGTSNTEFEVLTSMALDFFGTVEYPYETFLKNKTCESVAYDFSKMGYSTSAIHNFSASFYSRNTVYQNLGFDRFTSLEYMSDVEFNEIGWSKDSILKKYILENLNKSDSRDFIFSVSVQGHGSYPNDYRDDDYDVMPIFDENSQVIGFDKMIDFYTEQISEMDSMLESLSKSLENFDEPTILVVYGDHLPGINFTQDMLECDMYQTDYLIWANYDLTGENEDIETWQLMPKVQSLIGTNSGIITKFHQEYRNDENYLPFLQTLEYDMVEGENLSLNKTPYRPSQLIMGSDDIVIKSIQKSFDGLYIKGQNFTPYTTTYINNNRHNCDYIDSTTLFINDYIPEANDLIELGIFSYHNRFDVISKVCSTIYGR